MQAVKMTAAPSFAMTAGDPLILSVLIASLVIIFVVIKHLYKAFLGPLSKVPGPRWRAFSMLPHLRRMWLGDEAASVVRLHREYGPVVRLAPDLVSFIGTSQTWKTIYASKAKGVSAFHKDYIFYDKPFNNVEGPFGSDDTVNGRMRKTMAPAFSDSGLKQYEPRFKSWCDALAKRLNQDAREGKPVDMVKSFNCKFATSNDT